MKIGLTYTGKDEKHENYVRWLKGADRQIAVIRLDKDGIGAFAGCDGLVLSGGVDIEPGLYGGDTEYAHAPKRWQKERDEFELKALRLALERGVPVLGVCRGLQLVNVAMRGSLVQDLGPRDAVHEGEGEVDKQHDVIVLPGTVLGDIVGSARGVVNSAHHQAAGRLGEGLRISCRAEDGTIEGVEWAEPAGKTFLLAVQWHPERMYVNGVGDKGFYDAVRGRFIREANMAAGRR